MGLPMNAEEYRRRARRCLFLARRSASPQERARTIDTAMMWMELAEWAEGRWPPGKELPLEPRNTDDEAGRIEEFRFASEDRQEADRTKS